MGENSGVADGLVNRPPHIEADEVGNDMTTPKSKRTTTSPAFQFYPESWFSSSKVTSMSHTERGIYIDLLARCWLDKGLPSDVRKIAALVKIPAARFQRLWNDGALHECFIERGGRLVNPRQERERKKQIEFRQRQSDNGSKGGRPPRNPTESQPKATASSRVSVSEPRVKETETEDPSGVVILEKEKDAPIDRWLFDVQNGLYPSHRVSRSAVTQHAFTESLQDYPGGPTEAFRVFCSNLSANIESHEWRVKGMIPSLEKYMRDGLWLNVHPKHPPAAERLSKSTNKTLAAVAEIMGEDE